jgi:hypothetical protein
MQGNDDVHDEIILTSADVQVVGPNVFVAGLDIYQWLKFVTVIGPEQPSAPALVAPGTLCTPPAPGQIEPYTFPAALYGGEAAPAAFVEPAAFMSPAFF